MISNKNLAGGKAGFTLIELLVVIAIIGVLSSIGVGYMNNARKKAYDAETIAQLSMARNAAQLFYEGRNSYNGDSGNVARKCDEKDSMFTDLSSGMYQYTADFNYPSDTSLRCSSNQAAYQISASLSADGEYWCVNHQGLSKKITAQNHVQAHPNNDTDCTP